MIRIVADDKIPFLKGAFEEVAEIRYMPGAKISRSDLMESEALIIRTRTRCNRELLEGTPVRFIASATIGYDHIDADYCKSRGIEWTNAPGCNSSSVQQFLVSSLLYLIRHRDLDPQKITLGVVGVGNVGKKVAAAADILGMKVLLNDPPRQRTEKSEAFVDLDDLLSHSDIVTLHVPLNRGGLDNTYEMVSDRFTARMKQGAVLINTSRGPVVHEESLLRSREDGKLSDVILDVFPKEPYIEPALLKAITLATPHVAGYSVDGKANGTRMSVQSVSKFFNLGLDAWSPGFLPAPPETELFADAATGNLYETLWEIYRQSYDVTIDDKALRSRPGEFEKLRGDYRIRREPPAFSVRLFQGYHEVRVMLEKLGFSVLSDPCA